MFLDITNSPADAIAKKENKEKERKRENEIPH